MIHSRSAFTKTQLTDLFNQLVEHVDQGIRVIDAQEQLIIYNEKMRAIESMSYDDFTNKGLMEAFQFNDERDSRLLQAIKYGKQSLNEKQTYFTYLGEEVTTINEAFPIYSHGNIIAAAEVAKDITRMEKLVRENRKKKENSLFTFSDIIGNSNELREVIENASRATRTSSPVLIIGETGTGKELFAQSIHSESDRATGPFISQNCAALPETLIEGILFGTVKGAFTGATERAGLFEEAEGGTLLLDEINSLAPALQAKLLRVLQEKKVTRLGDTKERSFNVRVLTTMNEDPVEAIAAGRLRKDLYYRLSVVTLLIPPLRERIHDIEPLTATFIAKYNTIFQMNIENISVQLERRFLSYNWPGNVRELEHIIEGAMNLTIDEQMLQVHHLPPHFRHKTSKKGTLSALAQNENAVDLPTHLATVEKEWVQQALKQANGNVMKAAKDLGISRQSLQYRMQKFHLNRDPFLNG
ncbi:sigma-54 interaction domain-containing protein [Salsuginibacillus kocurii]|uniref:sigma-54 interaction domain-containing protein n=1 Tax=Salsuginibacillus kocurii TaxID=427078 RepID=UPI000371018C|nr:sigma-54-dependent Fis family transcriptional regulator [Salsuginibacillus kocurii]